VPPPPPPWRARVRPVPFTLGVAFFVALLTIETPLHGFGTYGDRPARAAAVTGLMAFFWLTEALPITLTACLPLLLFPVLGVFGQGPGADLATTLGPYVDPYIFLFLGGMGIAAAMQQWGLHRRLAVGIMAFLGTDPRRLLLGILCGSAFVSLWISNTATAAMMVPIALAVATALERQIGPGRMTAYGAALLLAVAYGANVGGIGTKIGTAPNAQFAQFMERTVGVEVGFLDFMAVGLPFVMLMLPVTWAVLWLAGRRDAPGADVGAAVVSAEHRALGPIARGEGVVLFVFVVTAGLWMAGRPLHGLLAPPLADAFGWTVTAAHVEGGIAMTALVALLLLRTGGQPVLAIRSLRFVPWDTLVLLGGAFSMAHGVQQSGLSIWIGSRLGAVAALDPTQQVLVATFVTVGLTAVASNTATTGVMLNVLRDAVPAANLSTVLFASTIAASLDFALPAGTPPNAIVFGTGFVTVAQMVRTGVVLDLLGAVMAAFWCIFAVPLVLD
jgi:sodium-dependent dicarboxylate transporter 2/3/5